MNVFWLQRTEADVPAHNDWLGANEALVLGGLRMAKRRADWRLGRWTAKCTIAAYLGWSAETDVLRQIEIRAAASGAPAAILAVKSPHLSISLSHSAGAAMCAVVPSETAALGCDLELIEERSEAFIADYFAPEEQAVVAGFPALLRPTLVTLLWSAKESTLKALHEGLRLDTRSVLISIAGDRGISGDAQQTAEREPNWPHACHWTPDVWRALQVRFTGSDQTLRGWWQYTGDLVRTVVAEPPLLPPVLMKPQL